MSHIPLSSFPLSSPKETSRIRGANAWQACQLQQCYKVTIITPRSMRADLQHMLGASKINSAWDDLAQGVPIAQVLSSTIPPCVQAALRSHCCRAVICSSGFTLETIHDEGVVLFPRADMLNVPPQLDPRRAALAYACACNLVKGSCLLQPHAV